MISKIGFKRAAVLIVLTAVLVCTFLLDQFVLAPKTLQSQQNLAGVQSETSTLQSEITKIREGFEKFETQKVLYETLKETGFFNNQDRVIARERFDTMQRLSKIISAKYEIKSAILQSQDDPVETTFVLMQSPITVTLSAVDDLDIYRFIYYLNYGFPGHITINNMTMERKSNVSPEVLQQIGSGLPPEMVSATLELDWFTMARKEAIAPQDLANGDPNATGGTP